MMLLTNGDIVIAKFYFGSIDLKHKVQIQFNDTGNIYVGKINADGTFTGEDCLLEDKQNKIKYKGGFVFGKKNGAGEEQCPEGVRKGQFKDDQFHTGQFID